MYLKGTNTGAEREKRECEEEVVTKPLLIIRS
jgi:hypothetical protein